MHSGTLKARIAMKTKVATLRQTLRHAEDIKDKKAIFVCLVATPVTPVEVCTMPA